MSLAISEDDLQALRGVVTAAVQSRYRHPLLIAGAAEQNYAIAQQICSEFFASSLWLGNAPPAWNGAALPASKAAQLLGQEFDAVVFDACAGLHPDALGIAVGLVRAGGLLLLLAPALNEWAQFDDPDYRRLMNAGELLQSSRFFLQRLCTRYLPAIRIVDTALQPLPAIDVTASAQANIEPPYASGDQRDAVAALQRVITGHRRRPLVLTADRGRGKSASIGIACAQLLQQGKKNLVLTAARPAMVQAALQHAQQLLPDSLRDGDALEWQQSIIRFVAPDALLSDLPSREAIDGIFVDEAAALPVPLLTKLLQKFSRIAFVSTIHGYEGSGRGFSVRFADVLRQQTPQFRSLHLSQPVRWNGGDPLEHWSNRLLCLDADVALGGVADNVTGVNIQDLAVQEVDRFAWLADEEKLRELFALLVLAHYQTTPSDLRFLLDAPGLRLFVATAQTTLVGAVITMTEGAVGEKMHEPIISGHRRLRGHLVSQRLAVDTGDIDWLTTRGLRISRVVVHPLWQRQQVGKKLLQCVEQCSLAAKDVDYLSTSFGATASLLQFWRDSDFIAARLGFTREQASGEHALIMVKPLTNRTRVLTTIAVVRWHEAFAFQLRAEFSLLDSELAVELLRRHASQLAQPHHVETVRRFTAAHLQLADSHWALWPCIVDAAASSRLSSLDAIDRNLLVAVVLQQQSLSKVARQLGFNSNAEAETALRNTIAGLL